MGNSKQYAKKRIKKYLRYDKLRRKFKHTGHGEWVLKDAYGVIDITCFVCNKPFRTYFLAFQDTSKHLKRIHPGTIMLSSCHSDECTNTYQINPLAYVHDL